MFRFILPTILVLISIITFLTYTSPTYTEIGILRTEQAAYDEALSNANQLLVVKNELADKYNSLSVENKARLNKLMPDNVDNIRLILDIQTIALKYAMAPRDIKFSPIQNTGSSTQKSVSAYAGYSPSTVAGSPDGKDYGSFDLEFSVIGTYGNFVSFLRDMEKSLRITDITSVSFSIPDTVGLPSNIYKYTFKTRTYWLKN